MSIPKYLVTVTPLSKSLAAILFIILPFISFYLGINYQKNLSYINSTIGITPSPFPIPTSQPDIDTFEYFGAYYSFKFPKDWYIAQETVDSVLLEKKESLEGTFVHPRQTITANIEITMKELHQPTTLDGWFNEIYFNNDKVIFDLTKQSIKKELLDNTPAFSVQVPGAAGYLDEGIITIKDNKGYSIFSTGITVSGYEDTYKTLIKSFRFVDPHEKICRVIIANEPHFPQFQCPKGYSCKPDVTSFNASGTCIKE